MRVRLSSLAVVVLGAVAGIATVAVVSFVVHQQLAQPSPEAGAASPSGTETPAGGAPQYDPLTSAVEELGFHAVSNIVTAEEFELADLRNGNRALSDFSGQLVLLNFWATWCPLCVEEMPSLQNLHAALEDDAFSVVAVNVQEDHARVNAFVQELGLDFPVLLDRNGATARRYAVRGMPSSYLIAPDGRVLGAKVGFHLWDEPGFAEGFRKVLELSS